MQGKTLLWRAKPGYLSDNSKSGLDVTLLVFIIIIALLVLGLTVILLVYWCCRPGRQQAD